MDVKGRESRTGKLVSFLRHDTVFRFIKFVGFGIINTVFGYAVFALLIFLGLKPQPALAISFPIGVLWNYVTSARFVFHETGLNKLPAYIAAYLAIYATNALILKLITSQGVPPLVAQAALLPFIAVLTFGILARVLTGQWPLLPKWHRPDE